METYFLFTYNVIINELDSVKGTAAVHSSNDEDKDAAWQKLVNYVKITAPDSEVLITSVLVQMIRKYMGYFTS